MPSELLDVIDDKYNQRFAWFLAGVFLERRKNHQNPLSLEDSRSLLDNTFHTNYSDILVYNAALAIIEGRA